MTWKETCHLIRSDVRRRMAYEGLSPSWPNACAAFFAPGNIALTLTRLHILAAAHRIPLAGRVLYVLNLMLFNCEIHGGAIIGEGCLFLSPCGIMIHGSTTIGRNCIFVHHLSLAIGPRLGIDMVNDRIILGDEVLVSAGVRIIGNLTIGDRCHIGPNKVIRNSLPAGTIVE